MRTSSRTRYHAGRRYLAPAIAVALILPLTGCGPDGEVTVHPVQKALVELAPVAKAHNEEVEELAKPQGR